MCLVLICSSKSSLEHKWKDGYPPRVILGLLPVVAGAFSGLRQLSDMPWPGRKAEREPLCHDGESNPGPILVGIVWVFDLLGISRACLD